MPCVVGSNFAANILRIDFSLSALNDHFVDTVFNKRRRVLNPPQSLSIRFILGEEQLRHSLTRKPVVAKVIMLRMYYSSILLHTSLHWLIRNSIQHRFAIIISPYPCIAEP